MKKIAVIEDDHITNDNYKNILNNANIDVEQFFNKNDAIKGVLNQKFDAWILDIDLGGLDRAGGIALIKHAIENKLPVAILVISGLGDIDIWKNVTTELNAWDHLEKPISDNRLLIETKRLLESGKSYCELEYGNIEHLSIKNHNTRIIFYWKGSRINPAQTASCFLGLLIKNPGKIISYDDFKKETKSGASKANIRQHIKNLIDCFVDIDSEFQHIINIPGRGYKWI